MQAHGADTSARSNNFDALRLLAALLVIWSHQFAVMGLPVPQLLHNEPGALGVVIFFAISGYLVTLSWLADPHLGRFAARRALRIWPGLIAAVLLCAFVLGPLVTTLPLKAYLAHPLTWDYLRNLWLDTQFALPGVFDGNVLASSVNGPLWTIPLEVGCYAFLAAAGALGVMRWPWVAPLAFLALLLGMQWHYSPAPGAAMPAWSFGLQYGMVFALGATLACWRHLWIERRLLAMTAMLLLLAVLYFKGPAIIAGQAPLLALAVFSVVAGSASTPLLKHAGHFGDFSYGLYIYAFPVQQLVVWHFADRLGYGAALACTVAGTGLLAVLSWHLLEKQALTFKPARPASGATKIPSSHVTG